MTVRYKAKDAADSAYTDEAPTNAGDYTVRVSVAEDETYEASYAKKHFTIGKAPLTVTAN